MLPLGLSSLGSGDGLSYRSSMYSITSSKAERLEENGRTYHSYKGTKRRDGNQQAQSLYPNRVGW